MVYFSAFYFLKSSPRHLNLNVFLVSCRLVFVQIYTFSSQLDILFFQLSHSRAATLQFISHLSFFNTFLHTLSVFPLATMSRNSIVPHILLFLPPTSVSIFLPLFLNPFPPPQLLSYTSSPLAFPNRRPVPLCHKQNGHASVD